MARDLLTDIDENTSYWAKSAVAPLRCPSLAKDHHADVTIVGGGFTGVSTAYHLKQRFPDKHIVLLEARGIGNGASGRNGGLVLNWVNGVDTQNEVDTRRIWDTTQRGMAIIDRMIANNGLKVRYRRQGNLEIFTDPARADSAQRQVEELQSWGIPLRFIPAAELPSHLKAQKAAGAIHDPTGGQIHGLDLLYGMKGVLLGMGVEIFEDTPVTDIKEGPTCTLTTPGGSVHTRAIVLATNAYTRHLGYFRDGLFPLQSHAVAIQNPPGISWEEIWGTAGGFFDDLDRIAYGGITPDGTLVFGGGSNLSYDYLYGNRTSWPGSVETASKSFAAIRKTLVDYFPGIDPIPFTHRWTGPIAITMSRVCSIGVRGDYHNVYYGVGFSGHGITLTHLAGEVITDMIAGEGQKWEGLPFYQQRLLPIPPDPFRWLGYHIYTRLTGKSPRRKL